MAVHKLPDLCTSFQQYGMEAAGVPDQPIEEAGMTPEVIQKVSYLIFMLVVREAIANVFTDL